MRGPHVLRLRYAPSTPINPISNILSAIYHMLYPTAFGSAVALYRTSANYLTCIACWASAGHNKAGCATIEQALRNCMDAPPPARPKASEINYHLSRFKGRLTFPEKKKR